MYGLFGELLFVEQVENSISVAHQLVLVECCDTVVDWAIGCHNSQPQQKNNGIKKTFEVSHKLAG